MIPELRAADKFGEYRLWYHKRVMRAQVTGPVGSGLARQFVGHVSELLPRIPDKTFAYLGNLKACDGYTPEVEPLLVASNMEGLKRGCIADAYLINSPVAIDQIRRIRQGVGLTDAFEDHLFSEESQALEYLYAIISKIDNL